MKKLETEVTIIGGGVIGSTIAYYLAKAGKDVILVEAQDLAAGPTSAASGVIAQLTRLPGDPIRLGKKTETLLPTLLSELDTDVDYHRMGMTVIAEEERYWEPLVEMGRAQEESGADLKFLDNRELRELEPAIAPDVLGGIYCPVDSRVNPMYFTYALARAARRRGCRIMLRTEAKSIELKGGRVAAVVTTAGKVRTRWVVNAAGVRSPEVGRLVGEDLPVVPRRGQVLITEPTPARIHTHVRAASTIRAKHREEVPLDPDDPAPGVALMAISSGSIIVGSTYEFVGHDNSITPRAILSMTRRAVRLFPFVKDLSMIRSYAGLRPYPLTPHNKPIVGPSEKVEGYIVATGHSGEGIGLAPVTAHYVAAIIQGDTDSFELERKVFVLPSEAA